MRGAPRVRAAAPLGSGVAPKSRMRRYLSSAALAVLRLRAGGGEPLRAGLPLRAVVRFAAVRLPPESCRVVLAMAVAGWGKMHPA
ncbi:hypothetical protein CO2235_MP40067 [Cupriavidus oxalaticus]|uniref:Uncharacterized protein n=1 Tax=Cupriavidus oxalaticus TaxID=96344 RepID=A0A375GFG0_9BURK|nr:hypothetical protein CO2235_MP40067 [Cupriavidus oxalaticus]